MEQQIQPTPSPSSLTSLLNPLPTTDHQQQQQYPLKKILLADNTTRSLPTKQSKTTKTTTDSPSPSTSLLFID
ncbi:hypothetical protein Pst134EA_003105 [Puccinia striiformis f. sp. tritici]|uniref:hypothetical protein n=1 Tax=Puccinia striiformis f. sp. tritici TaxID=168172 RepID=UPI0020074552|nr:hypothetical protein Pst134EA_003105 [Puccinia striiformis f. sp. tritici]KAH9472494.1 hypothetical protein Pst134EA_003105 [Puccinia striiformis f. sp. tritici]